jgi:hypothetical protein
MGQPFKGTITRQCRADDACVRSLRDICRSEYLAVARVLVSESAKLVASRPDAVVLVDPVTPELAHKSVWKSVRAIV